MILFTPLLSDPFNLPRWYLPSQVHMAQYSQTRSFCTKTSWMKYDNQCSVPTISTSFIAHRALAYYHLPSFSRPSLVNNYLALHCSSVYFLYFNFCFTSDQVPVNSAIIKEKYRHFQLSINLPPLGVF